MLDFLMIGQKVYPRKAVIDVYPKFLATTNSTDLMIRGGDFYAVYNEEKKSWTTDEQYVIDYIDKALKKKCAELEMHVDGYGKEFHVAYMWDADSGSIDKWHKYVQKQMRDQYHQLDEKVTFSNTETRKEDYVSKRLDYPLEKGTFDAYEELISTLYDEKERTKLEWAIGSIIAGDSKTIQKFIVLYGSAGSGKSTVLNIIQELFDGYYAIFDAKALGSSNNAFALESFKDNPLIAIQHDGDLSRIEDNTKLNSIVSHESIEINEKFKKKYTAKFNTFLFMGTNKPVRITEAKSGLIRRLIDVHPSGRKVSYSKYNELMNQIKFELSGIAYHCLERYKILGPNYYDAYIPRDMMSATNDFYDFIDNYFEEFEKMPYITLRDAWSLYKQYCEYANTAYPLSMRQVRVELKNYFEEYNDQKLVDGKHIRNVYTGFLSHKFDSIVPEEGSVAKEDLWLEFADTDSIFDKQFAEYPAQLANDDGNPRLKWERVKTRLADIDTGKLHWVKLPDNHIVIDFDLQNEEGEKSLQMNMEAASKWPKTYAELSKSGKGIHLHYFYSGDPNELSRVYDDNIEIKVFVGNSSLRRKLTKCNRMFVATLTSGLPLKGAKKMVDFDGLKSEKAIRSFIKNCILKKHWGSTAPEMQFMRKVLNDAYEKGVVYDVSDMQPRIMAFAGKSTHQSMECLKIARNLPYVSKPMLVCTIELKETEAEDTAIFFFDVEVLPNLFVLVYKQEGDGYKPVKLINPSAIDIERLCKHRLVGFNCRRYDNHILYARMVENFDNYQLFRLSQSIIEGKSNAMFKGAYNLSYADVYDFSSKKQSLKKFEIELGSPHQELGLPWDQDVPKELWSTVADYCANDVIATEAVWKARKADFVAREILADLADMPVNSTTNSLTTKIIFGNERNPDLVYTDLATGKQYYGKEKPEWQ